MDRHKEIFAKTVQEMHNVLQRAADLAENAMSYVPEFFKEKYQMEPKLDAILEELIGLKQFLVEIKESEEKGIEDFV